MHKLLTPLGLTLALVLTLGLVPAAWARHSAPVYDYHSKPAYDHHAELINAAEKLADASRRLHRRLYHKAHHSPLTYQAGELAEATHAFYEQVQYGARHRVLKRRLHALETCLDKLRSRFYRREYTTYSRGVERHLERTHYALNVVADSLRQHGRHYSYHDRQRPHDGYWR